MKAIFLFSSLVLTVSIALATSKPVETEKDVDLNLYLGKWYEIASIPQSFQSQCVSNTTAEYSLAEDGLIKIINSCETASGERSVDEGRAKVRDANVTAKLRVTFVKIINWVFTFGGDYWIMKLGDGYSYSVVGHPDRTYAWILSRTPSLSRDQLQAAYMNLKNQGYDTCKLLTSVQGGGFDRRQPLCQLFERP